MSSGLTNMFDLRDENQAKEYLDTLGIEYRFQCYHEKLPEGCHRLANFLEAFRKDFEKADKVYKSNCDEGNFAQSCYKYGNYRMLGRGGEKNMDTALEYHKKGCELGYFPSCHNVALMYQLGKVGEKKDFVKALGFLEKGCEGNNVESCQLLSTYYITGKEGIEKDMTKAFNYAKTACKGGHIYACVNISQMYRRGEGVEKNAAEADKYRTLAMELKKNLTEKERTITLNE